MKFEKTLTFARELDKKDPLRLFRNEFFIPIHNGKRAIYLTGNSLGLQPKSVPKILNDELHDWASLAVDGHFRARRPWLYYHKLTKKALSHLVGASTNEVVAMNQLTINLHLMMATFFRPTKSRYKIIAEGGAFSSDQYAIESQLKWHGLDPAEALIELYPRNGEDTLRTEDIVEAIRKDGDQVALILFGGVQYYTGQFFDIAAITKAAHDKGAVAGFDLAHAIGNVPLSLHKDGVDFAVWCSYKYLNSGPGSIAGAFVHEKHGNNKHLHRLAGWWGHLEEERFQMKKGFRPMPGVDGWQVSNVPIFQAAAHYAALEIFERAGMKAIRRKSELLTGYLEFLLKQIDPNEIHFRIITPSEKSARGCQLSILIFEDGKKIAAALEKQGVVTDWREPNVMRASPAPLYNNFEETFRFVMLFSAEITKKIERKAKQK